MEAGGTDVVAINGKAHHLCFIARSVNFPVSHQPIVVVANLKSEI
jgi:organic hydroperoxide reductase OsmC/OhrA